MSLGSAVFSGLAVTSRALQAANQRVQRAGFELIEAHEIGDQALAHFAVFVAEMRGFTSA